MQAPVSDEDPKAVGRRDFIKGAAILIGGLIGALIGFPSVAYLLSPVRVAGDEDAWIALGQPGDYPPGQPTSFEFPRTRVNGWERTAIRHGGYVVREEATGPRVFSDICTHLGCRVRWHPDVQHYISPCHDGHFDILGRNISGLPPRPLDEFVTQVEQGNLFIQLPPRQRSS